MKFTQTLVGKFIILNFTLIKNQPGYSIYQSGILPPHHWFSAIKVKIMSL